MSIRNPNYLDKNIVESPDVELKRFKGADFTSADVQAKFKKLINPDAIIAELEEKYEKGTLNLDTPTNSDMQNYLNQINSIRYCFEGILPLIKKDEMYDEIALAFIEKEFREVSKKLADFKKKMLESVKERSQACENEVCDCQKEIDEIDQTIKSTSKEIKRIIERHFGYNASEEAIVALLETIKAQKASDIKGGLKISDCLFTAKFSESHELKPFLDNLLSEMSRRKEVTSQQGAANKLNSTLRNISYFLNCSGIDYFITLFILTLEHAKANNSHMEAIKNRIKDEIDKKILDVYRWLENENIEASNKENVRKIDLTNIKFIIDDESKKIKIEAIQDGQSNFIEIKIPEDLLSFYRYHIACEIISRIKPEEPLDSKIAAAILIDFLARELSLIEYKEGTIQDKNGNSIQISGVTAELTDVMGRVLQKNKI